MKSKALIVSILIVFLIALTNCSLFGPDQEMFSVGIPVELTVAGSEDITILKADVTAGKVYKVIVDESPSDRSGHFSDIGIDLYPNNDDIYFYDLSLTQTPVYFDDDDSNDTNTVCFIPYASPFYIKIDPMFEFYGTVTATMTEVDMQELVADGSENTYISDSEYTVFRCSVTPGTVYTFAEDSSAMVTGISVHNDVNRETVNSDVYGNLEYTAVSSIAFVMIEIHPDTIGRSLTLSITPQ